MPEKLSPEQERLMRLRERQLSVRDPQEKQRKFQRMAASRERNRDVSVTIPEMWATIPQVWRWGLAGLVIGLIIAILLPRYWISPWANPAGIVAAIGLLMMSVTIGRALDLRDSIKKNL
jgi:uncharacterized membrane protein YraQ (UPF0718 family)